MGVTKQYLRYVKCNKCNIVTSNGCNVSFAAVKGVEGRYAATGACEDVIVWDLRLNEKAFVVNGDKHIVTRLSVHDQQLAVGYSDGTLKLFDISTCDEVAAFSGHSSAVTTINYDLQGSRIATGGKDTDIVVWDIVSECGLQRLSGHKGAITHVEFYNNDDSILVSSSKDSFIKLWHVDTGHCFKTIAEHVTEVWAMCLIRNGEYIVSGSADSNLSVWQIIKSDTDEGFQWTCKKAGSILRNGRGKVCSLECSAVGDILGVHGTDSTLELFQFLPTDQAKVKLKKRIRKERRKSGQDGETGENIDASTPVLVDIVRRLPVVKANGVINAFHLALGKGNELRVVVTLKNNAVELHSLLLEEKKREPVCLRKVTNDGHRSEVRAVTFSSDGLAVASADSHSLKLWSRGTLASIRTVKTGYALCVTFVPGDRHVLVGTKDGHLQIVDITTGDLLEDVAAHSSELWSVALLPDQTGVVTGGGDSCVKFWKWELVENNDSDSRAKVLSVVHTRTLKVDESVLCVRITPNSKFIAVALLDSTVKIFFLDTFKFFLSLYGHKLPVLSMDISYDSTLIATASADRNVKIWGMDFGDCHKSLFAHDDAVTSLAFVNKTHHFFTCGKDGAIKQWDADNFEKIITLEGHHGETWNLAVSSDGKYVVSCGQDRVIRLHERSLEPLVLEDEQEEEREKAEQGLATGPETSVAGHSQLKLPSRKTVTAEKAAELLLECLEVNAEYRQSMKDASSVGKPAPPVPAIMLAFNAKTPDEYLMQVLLHIRQSELEEALLFLSLTNVATLLPQLEPLLHTPHASVVCRVLAFLVRIHHQSIVSDPKLLPVINKLYNVADGACQQIRDQIGVNLYGLLVFKKEIEEKEGALFFVDTSLQNKAKQRKKRARENAVRRAVLSL